MTVRRWAAWSSWGELLVGRVVADGEAFEHAEPALSFGFGDAGGEVVADADEPRLVSEVAGAQHRAADVLL